MTPAQLEQLEVLRRIAERGLGYEQTFDDLDSGRTDLWQHMLDEIERTAKA